MHREKSLTILQSWSHCNNENVSNDRFLNTDLASSRVAVPSGLSRFFTGPFWQLSFDGRTFGLSGFFTGPFRQLSSNGRTSVLSGFFTGPFLQLSPDDRTSGQPFSRWRSISAKDAATLQTGHWVAGFLAAALANMAGILTALPCGGGLIFRHWSVQCCRAPCRNSKNNVF
jgi:hypothetical protein